MEKGEKTTNRQTQIKNIETMNHKEHNNCKENEDKTNTSEVRG